MSFAGIDLNLIGWGLIAVFGLFGAILGFCRGLGRTLWRILFVSLSVVASYFTARLLSRTLVRFFASRIDRYVSGGNLLEVLDELSENYPKTYQLAAAIVSAVGAIPLFLVVFAAMSLIFFIGYIILRFIVCREKPKMILRLPAALIGALGGVLVFLIFISPLSCTSVFVTENIERVEDLGDLEQVTEIAGEINDVNVIKASSSAPFMVLFDHLTAYRIGSASSNIRADVDLVFDVIENVQPLIGVKAAYFDEPQVEAIRNLMTLAAGSDIITNVYAEFISVSAQRYIDGKPVFGSSYEQLRSDLAILQSLDPIPDELLVILSETTPKNAGDDYTFISEEFAVLVRRGVLRMDKDSAQQIFSQPETLREILIPLFASVRTRRVASAVLLAGINYVSDTVELPANSTEAYRNLAVSACRAAASPNVQPGAALLNVLNKYQLNVGPDAAARLASALSGISEDAVDVHVRFSAAVDAVLNDTSVSLTKDQKKDLQSLVSSSAFGSRCVTKYSLLQSIRDAKTDLMKNSAEEEADCLVGAVNSFISFVKSVSLSRSGLSLSRTSLQRLGDGLVLLKKADSVPDSLPCDLAAGLFQSRSLSTVGFDLTGFVALLTDAIRKDDDGEAVRNVMDSIASAYSMANTLTSGGKPSANDIAALISSADEKTLNSLRSSLDTQFFEVQGLRADRAEKISTAVDVVLAKTAESEKMADKMEAEVDSLTCMMNMVGTLNSSGNQVFNTREEADSFVSAYLDSVICREAVKELVKGSGDTTVRDPLGLGMTMSAASVSNLAAAAQAASGNNEDLAALLAFIGR